MDSDRDDLFDDETARKALTETFKTTSKGALKNNFPFLKNWLGEGRDQV